MYLTGVLIVLPFVLTSCKKDDGPVEESPQEVAQALLEGSWNISNGSVILDEVDVSQDYVGFSVTFSDGGFQTTNAGDLFPANGSWSWVGETDNQVTTGNGKEITIIELTTTSIIFTFQKTAGNQAFGIPGSYEISMNK